MVARVIGRIGRLLSIVAGSMLLGLLAPIPAHAQMQQAMGIDATGFGQPVPAFAVSVPQSWQSRGGIHWGSRDPCNSYGYEVSWAAMSRDQRYGVAILPSIRWTDGSVGGRQCAVLQIGSARDAIGVIVANLLPNAQMLDFRSRPELLQELGLQASQFDLGQGAWIKTHVDSGEALFGFQDDTGNPMRALVALIVIAHETFMPGQGVIPDMRSVQGETLPAWAAFAPDGQLDLGMAEQMRRSVQINPDWQRRIQDHHAKIDGDNRRTQTNIANINRETNEYIGRLGQEGFENRMEAMDRNAASWSNMINERENWRDTDGTMLNAPVGGDNMWRLDNGDYVSTNDHNFNPLAATGQFGTQLQPWE